MRNKTAAFQDVLLKHDVQILSYFSNHGFSLTRKEIDTYTFEYVFRNGDLYVKFKGSTHPYDYPSYLNIIIGKGKDTFPDCDKNSVALWKIIRHNTGKQGASEYDFDLIYQKDFFKKIKKDMDENIVSFLSKKNTEILFLSKAVNL